MKCQGENVKVLQRRTLFDELLVEYGVERSVAAAPRGPFADFANDESLQKEVARTCSHAGILKDIFKMVSQSEQKEVARHIKVLYVWLLKYSWRGLRTVEAVQVERGEGPPPIVWKYATQYYRRAPDLVPPKEDQKYWRGALFIGTLDHAIDRSTLGYYGVHAVFSTLNRYQGAGNLELAGDTITAMKHRFQDIKYLDWCPRHRGKSPVQAFELLHALLSNGKTVLVHCRHGRDRSVFAVWAFLRLYCKYKEDSRYSPT